MGYVVNWHFESKDIIKIYVTVWGTAAFATPALYSRNAKGMCYEFSASKEMPLRLASMNSYFSAKKLVVVLFLDIILFSVSSNSTLLISACGCTIQTSSLFSNLLSNRSLIYLSAGVRGNTLFLLNCDCSKSSGRENNSITLKHWELSQRPVICFRAPDFSCRH